MSVLHWGENPRGEWSVVVNFKSGEGYVQMMGLNVTFYGISEDSVASVSEDCSPQCRGKCAKSNSPDHCDACWYYRDTESLTCLDYCDNNYEQYQNYCMPLRVREDSYFENHTTPYTLIPTSVIVNPTSCTVSCADYASTNKQMSRQNTDDIVPTATFMTWPSESHSNFTSCVTCSPDTWRTHRSQQFMSPVTTTIDLSRIAPSAVSDPLRVATIHPIFSTSSPPYNSIYIVTSAALWPTAVISLSVFNMFISTIFYYLT